MFVIVLNKVVCFRLSLNYTKKYNKFSNKITSKKKITILIKF